jgi:hypothetical protein
MILRFAYLRLQRPNQTTFSPGSAITTYVDTENASFSPLGASTLATAPSTLIEDHGSKNKYYLNAPFSAIHAVLTAATSDITPANLII